MEYYCLSANTTRLNTSRAATITIKRRYILVLALVIYGTGLLTQHLISIAGFTQTNNGADNTHQRCEKNTASPQIFNKNIASAANNQSAIRAPTAETTNQKNARNKKIDIATLIQEILALERNEQPYSDILRKIDSLSLHEKRQLLAAAATENGTHSFDAIIGAILTKIAFENPEESVRLFSELPEKHRKQHGVSFVYNLAMSDSGVAWDWLSSLQDDQIVPSGDLLTYQASVLNTMAGVPDTQIKAFENAKQIANSERAGTLTNIVIKQIAQSNIERAAELVLSLETKNSTAMDSLLNVWMQKDFEASYAFINSHRDRISQQMLKQISQALLSREDATGFQAFYDNTQSVNTKDELANSAASHFMGNDVEESARWISKIVSPEKKLRASIGVIRNTSNSQSVDMQLAFIDKMFPDNESQARFQLYFYALKELSKTNPERVSNILNSLKESDPGLHGFLKSQL